MGKSFNKGEWSEFYTFIKILADRKVYGANEDLQKMEDIFYPILKVLRSENTIDKIYDISKEDAIKISFQNQDFTIAPKLLKNSVKKVFDKIKNAKGASFEIPEVQEIMDLLQCETIKASRENKADIKVIIHDHITLRESEVGFSIKSHIGGKPTLLNASKSTNFVYNINELNDIDKNRINDINSKSKVRDKINSIEENSSEIIFSHTSSTVFEKNLRKTDSLMPLILSEFLLCFYRGQGKTIRELTDRVSDSEKIKSLDLKFDYDDIKFKIKHLLLNIALGMVPNTPWDGFLKADGGYIVVKEDGEIVCYHIYNISHFSEYLFNHTNLETASTGKHDFGTIYTEEGINKINLNLQIRF
ncbi:MAG: HpaII family restriction endonuclease [Flavobacteriales bacterium]|nr:HpaII family restriction endonuclease [Flavobacteriales bacterium]